MSELIFPNEDPQPTGAGPRPFDREWLIAESVAVLKSAKNLLNANDGFPGETSLARAESAVAIAAVYASLAAIAAPGPGRY